MWKEQTETLISQSSAERDERVTSRKLRGLQTDEIGCKCQTFFLSPVRGRRKQTTTVRSFSLKILCCHDNTLFYLNLTFLKPWANQCVFLMEMFFVSYVKETMYLPQNLGFFKSVPPKTQTLNQQWLNKPVLLTHGNVLLSYVNETMHLLGNLPFFKIHVNCFIVGMIQFVPMLSQNACYWRWAWCSSFSFEVLLYLISNLLTDI